MIEKKEYEDPFEKEPCASCKWKWINVMDGGSYYCNKYNYDVEKCEKVMSYEKKKPINGLNLHKKIVFLEQNIDYLTSELKNDTETILLCKEEVDPLIQCLCMYKEELEGKLEKIVI